jgi:hypothetical protein
MGGRASAAMLYDCEEQVMGHNVSWVFVARDPSWLGQILSEAPHFRQYNEPYYEFYSSANMSGHPDAIASVVATGLDFTDFGDSAVLADVLKFLHPHVFSRCGAIEEKY